jgi:hypothetical protein
MYVLVQTDLPFVKYGEMWTLICLSNAFICGLESTLCFLLHYQILPKPLEFECLRDWLQNTAIPGKQTNKQQPITCLSWRNIGVTAEKCVILSCGASLPRGPCFREIGLHNLHLSCPELNSVSYALGTRLRLLCVISVHEIWRLAKHKSKE